MYSFSDIAKIVQEELECPPYVFRFGCFQCIRELTGDKQTLPVRTAADDLPVHPVTGTITNHDCPHPNVHVWFAQAALWRVDADSNKEGWGYGGKGPISPHMTKGEIVKKFFVAARDYAEHEVREAFKYRGQRILGPHIDVDALADVAARTEVR